MHAEIARFEAMDVPARAAVMLRLCQAVTIAARGCYDAPDAAARELLEGVDTGFASATIASLLDPEGWNPQLLRDLRWAVNLALDGGGGNPGGVAGLPPFR